MAIKLPEFVVLLTLTFEGGLANNSKQSLDGLAASSTPLLDSNDKIDLEFGFISADLLPSLSKLPSQPSLLHQQIQIP